MQSFRQDPLLRGARALLTFLMALTAFVGVALALLIPIIQIKADSVGEAIGTHGPLATSEFMPALLTVLALLILMMPLTWRFLRDLRQIVDTVATGDPFVPANATRLRTMAWLSIAIQIVALLAGAASVVLERVASSVRADFDLSIEGILLPVALFILARVFRHGAAMREDLEGTV